MPEVILQPTPAVLKASEVLEEAVGRVLEAYGTVGPVGKYEADYEAKTLLWLIVRNVEGVYELARKDLVLLPPAMSAARSAFEIAIRALWLLAPSDPFQREVRWLAHLQTEENYLDRVANRLQLMGIPSTECANQAAVARKFRLDVTQLLPRGYSPLKKIPNLEEMLASLGLKDRYLNYIEFSQFAHGTHVAGGLYRKNLGCEKRSGEFICTADWYQPLGACAFALTNVGNRVVETFGGSSEPYLTESFLHELHVALDSVKKTK